MQLTCPVCAAPLAINADNRSACCEQNHSFDRARQGYWNLLLAQNKRSRNPGDSPEMVNARRTFLSAGHYAPLANKVTELLKAHLPAHASLIDLGCGEGYYTSQLADGLVEADICGLDISKPAIKAAAVNDKRIDWLVASSARVPLADNSCDAAVLIFSRLLPEEIARILRPDGLLCVVWPDEYHLYELRELIYDQVRLDQHSPEESLSAQFNTEAIASVETTLTLEGSEQINSLLAMTPHGQRIRSDARERILALPSLTTRAQFKIGLFRPKAQV